MRGVRLGVYEKALPPVGGWEERLEMVRSLGFDYLELSIDESAARLARLERKSAERRDIGRALTNSGVNVMSLCLSAHRRFALGSASSSTRRQALDQLDAAIELAVELGVRIVQLAGYFVYYEDETPDSYPRYLEGVASGASLAARAGVMLGIENMDTVGIASLEQGLRVVDQVKSPWLSLYPDVGNLVERGHDPLRELDLARGRMVAIHLKDAQPGAPRRVPFGEGGVPFDEVFAHLATSGFHGPMLVEMWNDDDPGAAERLVRAREWLVARMTAAGLHVAGVAA